jgi:light-independent protochlorophyllide reductase subunit B
MGLEEHLLAMFREDFEFNDRAAPSHLGAKAAPIEIAAKPVASAVPPQSAANDAILAWASEAELELKKIPFFVRGKARRNCESYARERGVRLITVETLYDAKAHFSR